MLRKQGVTQSGAAAPLLSRPGWGARSDVPAPLAADAREVEVEADLVAADVPARQLEVGELELGERADLHVGVGAAGRVAFRRDLALDAGGHDLDGLGRHARVGAELDVDGAEARLQRGRPDGQLAAPVGIDLGDDGDAHLDLGQAVRAVVLGVLPRRRAAVRVLLALECGVEPVVDGDLPIVPEPAPV